MFHTLFEKINIYLETLLERISLRKLLIILLLIFTALAMSLFSIFTYKAIYQSIYEEREDRLKYIDDLVIVILESENTHVIRKEKTLQQAQNEAISMIKRVRFGADDYIWLERYDGTTIYHPLPHYSSDFFVDSQIRKIVEKHGKGYLRYKWQKISENKNKKFDKVSYVEGYKPWKWIVGTGVYINDISYLVLKSILDGLLPVVLFVLLMIALLRLLVLKSIVKPIDKLAEISLRLSNNDLNVTLPTAKSDTEFGKLYRVFEKFMELFKRENKAAQRERLLRDITEKIRSSLSLDETLSFICEGTAKLFDVQRSAIATTSDKIPFQISDIKKEYKYSPDMKNYTEGSSFVETAHYWLDELKKTSNVVAFDNIYEADVPDYFKDTYSTIGVKSIIGTSIRKGDDIWGVLVLSEYNNYRHWSEDDKTLLQTIANQVYIAVNQAEQYETEKKLAEREKLIGSVVTKAISTFDINQIKQIVKEIGVMTKADRCYFVEVDVNGLQGKPISYDGEYLAYPDIKTIIGYHFNAEDVQKFVELYLKNRDLMVFDYEELKKEKSPYYDGIKRYADLFDIKSGIGIPFIYMNKLIAVLCIEYMKEKVLPTEDELGFLRILGNQTGMAFSQIQLYQDTKKTAEREHFLRKIVEAMRSSMNLGEIKQKLVTEAGKVMGADRCFILSYDSATEHFYIDKYSEYLSPNETKTFIDFDTTDPKAQWFIEQFKRNEEVDYFDIEEFISKNGLQGQPVEGFIREYNVKSCYNTSIYYAGKLLGYIILHYTSENRALSEDDASFLRVIANQAGIALYQATLYKKTQEQAEAEKFNRQILEILRNTLNKETIKHLFVKSIGQHFKADRVFFSEYDAQSDMYLPVDEESEYLSGPEQKSFIGYDWSDASVREYIQPLLDKRELNIFCWDDYIKVNHKSQDFISLFEDADVKSSYNFPVIYEGKIMGYFCIEFTKDECRKLGEEDIGRIRSMSSQAAIALYHAELYLEAKQAALCKVENPKKLPLQVEKSVNEILDKSTLLVKNEYERAIQIEYLNKIIQSCHQLLELTKDNY